MLLSAGGMAARRPSEVKAQGLPCAAENVVGADVSAADRQRKRAKQREDWLRAQRAAGGRPREFGGHDPALRPLPQEPQGIPPGVQRRIDLYGMTEADARASFAGSMVGMMLRHGDLTDEQARVCEWYALCHHLAMRALNGPPGDSSPWYDRVRGRSGGDTSAQDRDAAKRWERIRDALRSVHPRCEHVVKGVILRDEAVIPPNRQMWEAGVRMLAEVRDNAKW